MSTVVGGKPVGVRIPEHQTRNYSNLPPNTITQLVEMKVCGVGIVDHDGAVISTVAYKVGKEWWTDPNGEQWLKGLLRAGPDLAQALETAYEKQAVDVPEGEVKSNVKLSLTAKRIDDGAKAIADGAK